MGAQFLVVTDIAHGRISRGQSSLIHALHMELSTCQLTTAVVPQGEVEGVVFLKQARSQPVEIHEFAVLMLVEIEIIRQLHILEPVVQVDTRM